jgi:hypothetical protein
VLLGAEYEADLLTHKLKPRSITLHVPQGKTKWVAAKLQRVLTQRYGEVCILERFAPRIDTAVTGIHGDRTGFYPDNMAHPILVRSELLASDDSRLRGTAEMLLRENTLPTLGKDSVAT